MRANISERKKYAYDRNYSIFHITCDEEEACLCVVSNCRDTLGGHFELSGSSSGMLPSYNSKNLEEVDSFVRCAAASESNQSRARRDHYVPHGAEIGTNTRSQSIFRRKEVRTYTSWDECMTISQVTRIQLSSRWVARALMHDYDDPAFPVYSSNLRPQHLTRDTPTPTPRDWNEHWGHQ